MRWAFSKCDFLLKDVLVKTEGNLIQTCFQIILSQENKWIKARNF